MRSRVESTGTSPDARQVRALYLTRVKCGVALWSPNTPPWAACALAALRARRRGDRAQSTMDRSGRRRRSWTDAGATVVVTTPAAASRSARRRCPAYRAVVVARLRARRESPLSDSAVHTGRHRRAGVDPAAVALLPYSCGTTGLPKGVLLTHANLVTAVRQVQAVARFGPRDTVLALAPFFHVLGGVVTLAVPLAAGATVVTLPTAGPGLAARPDRPAPDHLHRGAAAGGRRPRPPAPALSSLELLAVGGAPLPLAVHEALAARLPRLRRRTGLGPDRDHCRRSAYRTGSTRARPAPWAGCCRTPSCAVVDPDDRPAGLGSGARRAVGPRPAGDGRLPAPAVRHRGDPRPGRLAAHRRPRPVDADGASPCSTGSRN